MRIRQKIQKRFSLDEVLLFVATFCVVSFALLENMSISIPAFSAVKNPLLYVAGVCVVSQINLLLRTFMKKKNFYIWIAVLVLCALLFLSTFINRKPVVGEVPLRSTVRMTLFFVELFALMIWVSERGHERFVVNLLFYYVLVLVILTDILLFSGIITFHDGSHECYLVGTKFTVSYLHMDLLMLWFIKENGQRDIRNVPKPVLFIATVLLVMVSIRVGCMTGVLGCIAQLALYLVINRPERKGLRFLNSPVTLVLVLLGSLSFPFVSELIMSIPTVKYFVVEILERSENLTGRIEIFQMFSDKLEGHWLFGFGLGNAHAASRALFGYANAQNALLQWILQAGVIPTVALVGLMVVVFRQRVRNRNFQNSMPLIALIYVYIVLGTVEITFGMSFFLWVALAYMLANKNRQSAKAPVLEGY